MVLVLDQLAAHTLFPTAVFKPASLSAAIFALAWAGYLAASPRARAAFVRERPPADEPLV